MRRNSAALSLYSGPVELDPMVSAWSSAVFLPVRRCIAALPVLAFMSSFLGAQETGLAD